MTEQEKKELSNLSDFDLRLYCNSKGISSYSLSREQMLKAIYEIESGPEIVEPPQTLPQVGLANGRFLKEQGIITNVDDEKNIQQVGIDLNVVRIERMIGHLYVSKWGENTLPLPMEVSLTADPNKEHCYYWELTPGSYHVYFKQGCKIPANMAMFIRQRSTLLRGGVQLHSSVFDPGFETNQIGTVINVLHTEKVFIEDGARIAQIYGAFTMPVSENDLYGNSSKGSQYQGK